VQADRLVNEIGIRLAPPCPHATNTLGDYLDAARFKQGRSIVQSVDLLLLNFLNQTVRGESSPMKSRADKVPTSPIRSEL
jgi:hypothetical protein